MKFANKLVNNFMYAFMVLALCLGAANTVNAADSLVVDIYGPGQRKVNLLILPPVLVDGSGTFISDKKDSLPTESSAFDKDITSDLGFMPFLKFVPMSELLGGNPAKGVRPADIDLKPLRLSKVDLVLTAGWEIAANGEKNLQLRVIGTYNGRTILGKKYSNINDAVLPKIADRFSSYLMKKLTGHDGFFESSIAFVKKIGNNKEIYSISPQGRNLKQITSLGGINLSPNWSPDGKDLVFTRLGSKQHILCYWDGETGKITQKTFVGNTIIGPEFLEDGRIALTLSTNGNSDIYIIDKNYKIKKTLAKSWAIEVSPDFDATGRKMVFTSGRYGNPHIFMLNRDTGVVSRVTRDGKYNTNPTISPDGRFVAFSRQTRNGHRIFMHDLESGRERQLTFGPGNDEDPAFGPDGYFIAFSSSRTGKYKLYFTTRHGDTPKMVPTGKGDATAPAWGKDVDK